MAELKVERKKSWGLRWIILALVFVAIAAYLAVQSRDDDVDVPAIEATTTN